MSSNNSIFYEHEVLHELKHCLSSQAPLKDFIHHNTLHAFQNMNLPNVSLQLLNFSPIAFGRPPSKESGHRLCF